MSKTKEYSSITRCFMLIALLPFAASASDDDYVNEAQNTCYKTQDTFSCVKYRTLRYVSGMAGSIWLSEEINNSSSRVLADDEKIVRLVRIKNPENLDMDVQGGGLFDDSRQIQNDSELDKVVKFGKRQMQLFLKSHGVSVSLPQGARAVVDDEFTSSLQDVARSDFDGQENHPRGKKKKLSILLPLLSLFGLLKIKLLLVPILLTVLFIKKLIILAALFLPSVLSTLKICKMMHPAQHTHAQFSGAEVSPDYSGGYSHSNYAQTPNSGYGKEWAASRAYSRHALAGSARTIDGLAPMDTNALYQTIHQT